MDLSQFNPQQQEAIVATNPYIKVIAGAGSGKTAVLTTRIAYLIMERNVNPARILAITFTNKAASEMKERVFDLLGEQRFEFTGLISTFHSFCLRILKEDINMLGYPRNFTIIDSDDQKSILKKINKELEYDSDVFKVKSIIAYISNKKNDYFEEGIDEYLAKIYDVYYEKYQTFLQENFYLDFDDLILKCVELFKTNQVILDKWRYRFNYIHVDEFQDTNASQYELVKLLGHEQNVFVVGDPDQNIYSWRGSKIDYILNFEDDFANAITIKLEYNYRSKAHILEIANDLIANNENRIEKNLIPTIDSEDKVVHFVANTADDEANYVVEKINDIITSVPGVNYDDFAILYRSNYISRVFEQKLNQARIDYKIIGGTRFFERKEIKDVLAYLKVIQNQDTLALMRIINLPKRKMGEKSIDKVVEYANQHQIQPYEALLNHLSDLKLTKVQTQNMDDLVEFIEESKNIDDVSELIENLINRFNLLEDYASGSIDYETRNQNLQELISYAITNDENLEDFLLNVSLVNNDNEEHTPQVSLMTMHSAKGLEFDYVFAVHLNDGVFPSMFSMERLNFEEERRLAYVAFTRAKKQLYLLSHTFSKGMFNGNTSSSLFVKEIDTQHLDKEGRYLQDLHAPIQVNEMELLKKKKAKLTSAEDFRAGDKVNHPSFKKGIILEINDNIAKIAFGADVGIKHINLDFIEKIS